MGEAVVDLRSDTVTRPTEEMRKAMYEAEVGDDVIGDDPTVQALEHLGAEMLGKEASLFVPSGTFGNQLALFTHCARGAEVILPERSHIVQHEAGASAVISGVQLRTLRPTGGAISWGDVIEIVRIGDDIHYPPTGLIEYENATSEGDIIDLAVMREIAREARQRSIPVHLDGARIFNAATTLGVPASEIADTVDSVMFCLSKGLSAPVGSLVAGPKGFIELARRRRKIMGGGMRQVGVIAAPGLVALREMTGRLAEDHARAAVFADAFRRTGLFEIRPDPPRINMFFVRFGSARLRGRAAELVELLQEKGVLTYAPEDEWIRFVTHREVSDDDISSACSAVEDLTDREHYS